MDRFIAFSMTGHWYATAKEFQRQNEFDCVAIRSKYFEKNKIITTNTHVIKVLANELQREYHKFLNTSNQPALFPDWTEAPLLDCLLYGFDASTKNYILYIIATTYKINNTPLQDKFPVSYKCGRAAFGRISKSMICGKPELISELINGKSKDFDSLRENKLVKDY